MPIILKREKKKITWFFYLAIGGIILVVGFFVYSKWQSQVKVAIEEFSTKRKVDVTQGLGGIKLEEVEKVIENPVYKNLNSQSVFLSPEVAGKENPFSGY